MGDGLLSLKWRLESLNYVDPVDHASVPLVQKLLDDLVHTTESYQTLKLQCGKQAQELSSSDTKVGGTRPGCIYTHTLTVQQQQHTHTIIHMHTAWTHSLYAHTCPHYSPACMVAWTPAMLPAWPQWDVLRQDASRLQQENSQLHVLLIQAAEKFDRCVFFFRGGEDEAGCISGWRGQRGR